MKVLFDSSIGEFSGYGSDGLGIIRALMNLGADVYLKPRYIDPPLPEDIAMLLTKPLEAPFDLFLSHVDPGALSLKENSAPASALNVAWTMWERTSYSDAPKKHRKSIQERIKYFDLLLGYDAVSLQALGPYAEANEILTAKLQGGFDPEFWQPPVERDWHSDRFGFCQNGQLHERKSPFSSIEAFGYLKDNYPKDFEGAELHLHTTIPGLHPLMEQRYPKLRIHYATWPKETLRAFYHAQHVLLAPSRGEGKNLPALEFQATGGAVMMTNFGGHVEWGSKEYAYPLDYELVAHDGKYPDCLSAKVDMEQFKDTMMHVYQNRAEVRQKAELAAEIIPKMCNWDSVMARFFQTIKDTVPGKGEALWMKYKMCRPL